MDNILTEGDLYGDRHPIYSTNGVRNVRKLSDKFIKDIVYAERKEDQIRHLLQYEPTVAEEREVARYRDTIRKLVPTRSQNLLLSKFWTFRNYVKGLLRAVSLTKEIFNDDVLETEIIFLYVLGNNPQEILYTIYLMGYRNVSLNQLQIYLGRDSTKLKIQEQKVKFMSELQSVKDGIFQELKADVMTAEKRHLQYLLKQLPKLEAALEDTDIIIEHTKWNRINRQILAIHNEIKDMHGINLAREVMTKAVGAVYVQKEIDGNKGGLPTLPMPEKFQEMEEINESKTHVLR